MTLLLFATLRDPTLFFAEAKLSTNSPPNGDQNLKRTAIDERFFPLLRGRNGSIADYLPIKAVWRRQPRRLTSCRRKPDR